MFTQRRIILLLMFFCFVFLLSNLNFCFEKYKISKQFVSAQYSTAEDAGSLSDPSGGNANGLYSSFSGTQDVSPAKNGSSGAGIIGGMLLQALNAILYGILKFVALIVVLAANLFDWAVNANNFKEVMAMTSIKSGWTIFRDVLNLFFILVLLFSAFCTIFQVEKYHIKKIMLTLVIMALLVNFSFPISRFIIDAGNIPMYHFLKAIGGDSGSISKMLWNDANGNAGLQQVLLPDVKNIGGLKDTGSQTFSLIAAIVFLFIFGITLLVIAVLLVIRILVLALLIMASPIGFTGAIFPAFKGYADSWWGQLFKQSFFGTIMAFMLYISLMVMRESQKGFAEKMASTAGVAATGGGDFSAIVVGGVTLAIPIILLWIAMISAQKMGAAGASSVVGQGKKFAKWAGKGLWKATKIPGTSKAAWDGFTKEGKLFGKKVPLIGSRSREESEKKLAGFITGGVSGYRGADEANMRNQAAEYKKTKSISELKLLAQKGDPAAAYALTETRDIDKAEYEGFMKVNKNPILRKALDNKVKQSRRDLVAMNKAKDEEEIAKAKTAIAAKRGPNVQASSVTDNEAKDHIIKIEMGKLTAENFAGQDWDDVENTINRYLSDEEKTLLKNAVEHSFANLKGEGRAEALKRLSGTNAASLSSINPAIFK